LLLNLDKIENLLLTSWTQFTNYRELLSLCAEFSHEHLDTQGTIHTLKMTRFELTSKGFIIWVEYSIDNKNITSEFTLSNSEITHLQTKEA
jgi:hypothetical protein